MSDELMRLVKLYERELERLRAFEVSWAASVWDDERVPVTAAKTGGTHDPGFTAAFGTVRVYWFDAGTDEELFFTLQLPHAWKVGSNIHAHVHWVGEDDGTVPANAVRWGLEYTWANIGASFGGPVTIYGISHTPSEIIVGGKHYLTELGVISGAGKTMSSMLICRIFRDANDAADTYIYDAGLLEIDFHILKDANGSREEYVK